LRQYVFFTVSSVINQDGAMESYKRDR